MPRIYVRASATGANNGTSWTDAYTSLVTALAAASSGDEIWVSNETYNPGGAAGDYFDVAVGNLTIYGGFLGTETSISQRRLTVNKTTLDGQSTNENILITSNTVHPSTLLIDGFKFIDAAGNSDGGAVILDYAVASFNGSFVTTFRNCDFEGNATSLRGGAINLKNNASGEDPSVVVEDCYFYNNSSTFDGGCVSNYSSGGVTVRRSFFKSNTAGRSGGALFLDRNPIVIENCIFTGNTADDGGAYYNASGGTLRNCVFYNNTATTGDGGAVYVINVGSGSWDNNIFYNNSAGGNGDQVYGGFNTTGLTLGYSRFDSLTSTDVDGVTLGSGNITGDPKFKDVTNDNFQLLLSSPCIDAGDGSNAADTDYLGVKRKQIVEDPTGTGTVNYSDIGAYEYWGTQVRRFYVFLDNSYTSTGHVGTQEDPFSYEDLIAFLPYSKDGDVYLLRGERSASTQNTFLFTEELNITFMAWDLDEYGPWRIIQPAGQQFAYRFFYQDGYLEAESLYAWNGSKNMYFRAVGTSIYNIVGGDHENSTFVTNGASYNLRSYTPTPDLTFTRCAFYGNTGAYMIDPLSYPDTIGVTDCLSNHANEAAFIDGTKLTLSPNTITYAWSPPAIPTGSGNTDLTDFALSTSNAGVGYGDGWANGNTYFVNFSEATTGNDGYYGEDYIGWDEFVVLATPSSNNLTFKARGLKTLTADSINVIKDCYISAWNLSKYGPWKIDGDGGTYLLGTQAHEIKEGIAYDLNQITASDLFDRMYFYNTGVGTFQGTVQNSTCVSTSSSYILLSNGNGTVSNCVLSNYTITPNGNNGSTYENIITDKANQTALVTNPGSGETYTNITYNWAAPASPPDGTDLNYNNYQLEGSPSAVDYGVQNFPTISYVNVGTSNDTSLTDGSDSSSPAPYAYMADKLTSLNRALFYVQGYRDLSTEATVLDIGWVNENSPYANNRVYDWDNDTYGPWRIRSTDATIKGINLLNGIIYATQDIILSGYTNEDGTDKTYIRDTFLNATNQLKVGSGSKDVLASNLISTTEDIEFFQENPSWVNDGWTYLQDPFTYGAYNSWWDSEFTTDANKFELEERPVGSGSFVAVQNGSATVQLSPPGINLTGDFVLEMCFALADNNTGNVSQKIFLRNPSGGGIETAFRYVPNTLTFDNIGSVTVAYSPLRKIYCRLTRVDGVITAEYSVDNPYDWTAVSGSHSYSGAFYLDTEGADNHGVGCFRFQAEGVTPGDTSSFPYGGIGKDNDTDIIDSVIDTPAIDIDLWVYSSIDLQDVAQTGTTWVGTSIAYTGTNQQSLGITWPSWSSVSSNTKEDFSYATVGSAITIPGSGSYTDYPEGLWGESRIGVGAFYFGLVLDLQGDTLSYVYKDPASEIVAKATFGGATYAVNVSFEPLYDTGATSWNWDFGDGGTSTSRTPTHEYVGEGVYTVTLYINGDTGTTVTKTGYIVVVNELDFDVIVDPSAWYGGLPKTFDIGVTGATRPLDPVPDPPYEAFSWDLGNGDTDANVTGLQYSGYVSENVYTVQATARDIGVSGLDYTKQSVTSSTQLIILSFTLDINPNSLYVNNPVSYTITFSGTPPSSLRWDFGDGSPVHNKANPGASYSVSHTFTSAGIYDAVLTLDAGLPSENVFTYSAGDPNLSELRVFVSDLSPDFNVVPNSGKIPLTGVFTDASIGTPTGWEWDFGDGFTGSTTSPIIIHTYTGIGVFNPLMTVYDIYGFNASVSKTVTVSGQLLIDISINPSSGEVPVTYTFTPLGDSGIVQWDWEIIYDDPVLGEIVVFSKSTTDPLDKIFVQEIVAPATYTVKLEATDFISTVYTATETFTPTENISILANPNAGDAPLSVDFSLLNAQPSTISRVQWDFTNDGIVDSDETNPTHVYNSTGTYTVSLDLLWYMNPEETSLITVNKTTQVSVGSSDLQIGFSAVPSTGRVPLSVIFNGISNNAVSSWTWEIDGIGTVSTAQTFSYLFSSTGTYEVTLTVVDAFSQSATITRSIIVTDSIVTVDEAVDPADTESSIGVMTGPGTLIEPEDKGVKVSIPLDSNEVSASGFSRKKGPSLIFD